MDLVEKYLTEKEAPHDKRDKTSEWRAGFVEEWLPAMNNWNRSGERVTIKPNMSVKKMEQQLSKERKTKVRLYIPNF